jgi:septal ring factor EnvC (AmiA/AmiB activator)
VDSFAPADKPMNRTLSFRRVVLLSLLIAAAALIPAGQSAGDLASRIAAAKQRASSLGSTIRAESGRIQGFEGTIGALQTRLTAIESSVAVQEGLLATVREQLTRARARLALLQAQYARDRQVLAAELLAEYESPPPTLVNVVVDARGFDDLLNRVRNLKTIERQNAQITQLVRSTRLAVEAQAQRLAALQGRRERATVAVLLERDQVAQLKISIVNRELVVVRSRSRHTAELTSLRLTLSKESAILEARAAAAQAAQTPAVADTSAPSPAGGCVNTPFAAHGGTFGFFPAPGTEYTVNQEPIIAARLDALGLALQLHLIGVSGYRTPQHSVEVGGFADDPHTHGLASDTPGVEGVPEATLERFCLTRPFPGAREADHIQEL